MTQSVPAIDLYASTRKRNEAMAKEAKKKRAKFLALLPDEFTMREANNIWQLKDNAASALIQKMVKHKEVVPITAYKTPRRYQKCPIT